MRTEQLRRVLGLVLIAVVSLGVAACSGSSSNFSEDDFKKVEPNMSEDKVKDLLGKPYDSVEAKNGETRMWWRVGDDYYGVTFKEGKVIASEAKNDKKWYEADKQTMKNIKAP